MRCCLVYLCFVLVLLYRGRSPRLSITVHLLRQPARLSQRHCPFVSTSLLLPRFDHIDNSGQALLHRVRFRSSLVTTITSHSHVLDSVQLCFSTLLARFRMPSLGSLSHLVEHHEFTVYRPTSHISITRGLPSRTGSHTLFLHCDFSPHVDLIASTRIPLTVVRPSSHHGLWSPKSLLDLSCNIFSTSTTIIRKSAHMFPSCIGWSRQHFFSRMLD